MDGSLSKEDLLSLSGITNVVQKGDKWIISVDNRDIAVRSLVILCEQNNLAILSLHTLLPSLDEVFLRLTNGESS